MQYHNYGYRLKETLRITAEINRKFPSDLSERKSKSPRKTAWKDYKFLFVLGFFFVVCLVTSFKLPPGSLCLFHPPFLLPCYAHIGIKRCLLTFVGLLGEQYTAEHKAGQKTLTK